MTGAALASATWRLFRLPRPVLWLSAAAFCASLATMAMKFLALYLADNFAYSIADIGRALMAYGLGAIAGAFGGGALTDRLGARSVLLASLLLLIPAFTIFTFAAPAAVPFVLFALGILQSAFRPAYNGALLRLCPPEERTRSYSAYITAVNIGGALAGALGGFLAAHDFRLILAVSALPPVLAALCVWQALPDTRGQPGRTAASHAQAGDRFALLRDWRFLALCLVAFFGAFVIAQLFSTYPIYLKDQYGFTAEAFGYLLLVNGLLVAAASLPLTTLCGRYRDDVVAILAIMLFGCGFALLPLSTAAWFAIASMIVWTLGEILLWPTLMKLAMGAAEQQSGGAYLGAYHSVFSISQVTSPLLGAWIYAALGGDALWLICGGLCLLGAALLWTFNHGRMRAVPLVSLEKVRK